MNYSWKQIGDIMNNYNFIPMWYEKQQKEKKIKLLKNAAAIILFIDIVLFDLSYYGMHEINSIDKEIGKARDTMEAKYKQSNLKSRNISSLETLKKFYSYPYIYNKCSWINIKNKEVEAEIKIDSEDDYYNLIRFLDDTKGVKIKYISPVENNLMKLIIDLG
ncbi:hypothetical protein [Clostridium sp. JN-9]|uniref:hypothetical protein n=1 Tax=Clostridium sp. JN-9 TaxID=2507159 RepID=UPI000FFE02F5|nr:hypothetical protein [Clostridium sp. JN-9]QAT40044.1 hypothetical protein EQM05_07135 [Clostridium sp. JN-9]